MKEAHDAKEERRKLEREFDEVLMSVSNSSEKHTGANFSNEMLVEDGMRIIDAEAMMVESKTCRYLKADIPRASAQ